MNAEASRDLAVSALEELKGRELKVLDVRELTGVTDFMIICTGTSNRHVKSLGDNVVEKFREQGVRPIGVEGQQQAEWLLADFGDVVVHVMLPESRTFYDLERLWGPPKLLSNDAD